MQFRINRAFEGLDEILHGCFAKDKSGSVFLVENMHQLTIGQVVAMVLNTDLAIPNYFFNDRYITDITTASAWSASKLRV